MNRTQVIMAFFIAFTLIVALFMIPPRSSVKIDEAATGAAMQAIAPAADLSKPAKTPAPAQQEKAMTPAEAPAATYATEAECRVATGMACHEVKCQNMTEGLTMAEICGANFREGWQALPAGQVDMPQVVPPPPVDMKTGPEQAPSP